MNKSAVVGAIPHYHGHAEVSSMKQYSIVIVCMLAILGCEGGGGGGDNQDDEITLCTTYPEMDTALANAAQLWNDGYVDKADPIKPPGRWLDFQTIANHEVGHIVMDGRGDEHPQSADAIMHKDMCIRCFRHALTDADLALLKREEKKDEVRTVVYLGVQDDTSICDFEAEWVTDDGDIARVRGNKLQFQREGCSVGGSVCFPWLFPQEEG